MLKSCTQNKDSSKDLEKIKPQKFFHSFVCGRHFCCVTRQIFFFFFLKSNKLRMKNIVKGCHKMNKLTLSNPKVVNLPCKNGLGLPDNLICSESVSVCTTSGAHMPFYTEPCCHTLGGN